MDDSKVFGMKNSRHSRTGRMGWLFNDLEKSVGKAVWGEYPKPNQEVGFGYSKFKMVVMHPTTDFQ